MTIQEKLDIVNAGGMIDESDSCNNWIGTLIKKGDRIGQVIKDTNGCFRELTVRFDDDGSEEMIRLNNIGHDPECVHQYEWLSKGNWYQF